MASFSDHHIDEITGLNNHSYLHNQILQEFTQAKNDRYPLSCLMLDLDHFRQINESKGYHVGDSVLRQCADILRRFCNGNHLTSRYSGEKFAIILPRANYSEAKALADCLRVAYAKHLFICDSSEICLTVSIGIACYPEDALDQCSELIAYANQALFRSKTTGRNTVTCYKDIVPIIGEDLPELKISEGRIVEFQRRMSEITNITRQAYLDASKALIAALESKDSYTAGHASRCAKYSTQVGELMGMSKDDAEITEHAALLHDIGKICVPDAILLKPAHLNFEEYEAMKQHPYLGYKILKPIRFLQEEATLVLHHHEWFNGEGYPCRLKGNEIPIGSRIISVIDCYDTMRVAGGRYKRTVSAEEAVTELVACSGAQFDPKAVQAFIEVLKERDEFVPNAAQKNQIDELLQNLLKDR